MKMLIAVLLVIHGLIVAAQSPSSFNPGAGIPNPTWLNAWPAALGQSWLLSSLGIERSLIARSGGIVWLAAGILLVAAGLGALGVFVPTALWRSFALAGAAISLGMLVVYLHPFFIIGMATDLAILAALWSAKGSLLVQHGL